MIDDYLVWNLTLNYTVDSWSFFASVKNLTDEEYIVDRTRGTYAGMGRQFIAGATWRF